MFSINHYRYITSHINQTALVESLLLADFFDYSDIFNKKEEVIFQWLAFPNFLKEDYEKLKSAGIPVLESDYSSWLGITSYGSPYTDIVYPEIIEALFDIKVGSEDIQQVLHK